MAMLLQQQALTPNMIDDLAGQYNAMLQSTGDPAFDAKRQQMFAQNAAMQQNQPLRINVGTQPVPQNEMVQAPIETMTMPQTNAMLTRRPENLMEAVVSQMAAPQGEQPLGGYVSGNWQDLLKQGVAGLEDQALRENLPADTYLKMRSIENEKTLAEQNQFLNNLKLQADLDYQRQSIDLKREELAMERQRVLSGGESPSAVREYQFYSGLTPEEQSRYLSVKRAQQVLDLGPSFGVLSPEGAVTPVADKQLAPADLPETKYQQTEAQEKAKVDVALEETLRKKSVDGNDSLMLLTKAKELLPQATAGKLQEGVKAGAAVFGKATEGSPADAQLNIISAKLVGTVPRFEGPQSNTDVQMYKEAAGNLANTSLPAADRMAAADFMMELASKYAKKPEAKSTTSTPSVDPALLEFMSPEERALFQ